ncbi:cytoplasmic dynein 2 heavy chain 1-like [Schistocerca cancellata]|uniref:cytoplasmic dynein 2 heavy chain 1-like n=1 Tax=Schistocerca cancellata TaxID=274614 RepID=UPI002117999E|nr:cytoplasmic dynein 2 heavy chain 1-like [Schistocerca cancellata]
MGIVDDRRKKFILTLAAYHFDVTLNDDQYKELGSDKGLDEFLDDRSLVTLSVVHKDAKLQLSTRVDAGEGKNSLLVFFKIQPDVITPDNIYETISMTTVASSPLVTFYYTIKEVYTPILLQAGNSSNQIDSSLQDLITKLQDRLKCTLQKIGKSVENDAVDNVE